jgi:hypothetical protein
VAQLALLMLLSGWLAQAPCWLAHDAEDIANFASSIEQIGVNQRQAKRDAMRRDLLCTLELLK